MSSGTPVNPAAGSNFVYSNMSSQGIEQGTVPAHGPAFALSPRQMDLGAYWSYYRCRNYDTRTVDWNGQPVTSGLDHEVIVSQAYTPPGFYDAGANYPIKFRRPYAPYYLAKIIVDRFSGLLFSTSRQPSLTYAGDEQTEDYMRTVAKVGRLWPAMAQARRFGGAMGSAAIGFSIVAGKPRFETHDPRWTQPTFKDRHELILRQIEKRYVYPHYVRDPNEGEWIEVWFWYRRVINEHIDEVWERVPVEDGEEPIWEHHESSKVEHGLGICPVVWIQNTPEEDDIDGDPDCWGIFDIIEEHDALISQASRGVKANCDPTLWISSDEEVDGPIQKGSDNALKYEKGSNARYLEITGAGPRAATEMAGELRERAYEIAAVVPDDISAIEKTATEIRARMARMTEKADSLREQYGEMGIKKLLEIAEFVIRQTVGTRNVEREFSDGDNVESIRKTMRVTSTLELPPRYEESDEGTKIPIPRVLGPGSYLELKWPRYFEPTLEEISKAVLAAVAGISGGVMDMKMAIAFLKQYLPIEDEEAIVKRLEKKMEETEQDMTQFQMFT
ncbi:hypothetical protein LCGC14_0414550 [marine sediment metagenome]|uniref:Portal protein n=1 Tax=marine sediment metagenome TaxID=412755 RepID=A0A0F9SSS4_9ZZZZ